MSRYGGNRPNSASFISDTFNGDASTVAFTLAAAPGSPSALIVTIEGVKQHVSAYSVSGVTLTFTAAPPTGTNNIEVIHLGVRAEIGQPAVATVGPNETTGMQNVIQVVLGEDCTMSTTTTVLPSDNTSPQSNEGVEVLTQSFTPTDSSNILIIEAMTSLGHNSSGANATIALFKDSAADAIGAALAGIFTSQRIQQLAIRHKMVAGTTSAITFKLRAGTDVGGTTTINGYNSSAMYNGAMCSSIMITEYKA